MKRGAIACLVAACALSSAVGAQGTHVYWGDTHVHTGNSFDVYLFGTPTATPDTAYRFAKGLPVINPATGTRWQLTTPLDFLVVADHAEALGALPRIFAGDPELADTRMGKLIREMAPDQTQDELLKVYKMFVRAGTGEQTEQGITAKDLYVDLHAGDRRRGAWDSYIETAERHNSPGEFTALIGWEWTSMPKGGNLHRVIFMPQVDAKTASYRNSIGDTTQSGVARSGF